MEHTILGRTVIALLLAIAVAIAVILPIPVESQPSPTYTLNNDFDLGMLLNLNYDIADQLQLNETARPFPFVNIACSGRGTIVRIDANTGEVLGEYLTAPEGMGQDPSRTTVDHYGNVWVANRAEGGESPSGSGTYKGSVTRIALIIGGTRVDQHGTPNPQGQYLAPPFAYNTAVDRDGDDLIKTSLGLGNFLPWSNDGGADTHGGVSTAEDEAIINYTRVVGTGTRTLAVDANNDLWVGGLSNTEHEKLDGETGLPIQGSQFNFNCGGYGGLVDRYGVLWSARAPLRYDPAAESGSCLAHNGYGLGIDPNTGNVWLSSVDVEGEYYVAELNPLGAILSKYLQGFGYAQGVAVDGNSHVWVAALFGTQVAHYAPDPSNLDTHVFVGYVEDFNGATGVAVDANGKIWVSEIHVNRASRIDPNDGPVGSCDYTIGVIDMQVPLGSEALPYNYSDMTGFVAIANPPRGTWTVVQDSGVDWASWRTITWNNEPEGYEPEGSSITVQARAHNSDAGLAGEPWKEVGNGVAFQCVGRYIEVRVTLSQGSADSSPVLSDITIEAAHGTIPLDHFLLYSVQGDSVWTGVTLDDQFASYSFAVWNPPWFANPCEKWHNNVTTPIANPDHHLTFYALSYPAAAALVPMMVAPNPEWTVEVNNQFGTQQLLLAGDPIMLAVPTQKEGHESPVCLDHFLLYEVIESSWEEEVLVELDDQFGHYPEVSVLRPVYFANPVKKTHGEAVTEIVNPDEHLVFYELSTGDQDRDIPLTIGNQFGDAQPLNVLKGPQLLGVPSEKVRADKLCTLTVSSTSGGSVTVPGEGTFTYPYCTVVELNAVPDAGFHFVNWTGDVGTVEDPTSPSTTIHVDCNNRSITANFKKSGCGLTDSEGMATMGLLMLVTAALVVQTRRRGSGRIIADGWRRRLQ